MRTVLQCVAVACAFLSASADEPVRLWTGGTYPARAQLARAAGVRYSTIKAHEPEKDGFEWLHGVGLGWHGNRLYATYGTNPGRENTAGECCMCRYSEDDGRTWSAPQVVDAGEPAARLAVSHGVLLSKAGRLLSFMGAFTNDMRAVHTRLSVLDPDATSWRHVGVVVGDGFWPMQPPERMSDGNWIMGGLRCSKGLKDAKGGNRPAVAISAGDDLTKWRLVVVEEGAVENCWGEATVDVHGPFATLVSRPGWKNDPAVALVATSADFGCTWTALRPSNLPMTTAKPYTGWLSDGRRYALNSMTADGRWNRDSIVLALSRPGEWAYSQALLVRSSDDFAPDARGRRTRMCYPAAVEKDGRLYVGYSISRLGGNRNDAELAVVPLPNGPKSE